MDIFRKGSRAAASAFGRSRDDQPVDTPTAPDYPLGASGASAFAWALNGSMSDEFNGATLDLGKWLPMNPQWKGRPPGWFSSRNVTVEDGALTLTCRVEQPPPGEPPEFKVLFPRALLVLWLQPYGDFVAVSELNSNRRGLVFSSVAGLNDVLCADIGTSVLWIL
jgi:hypothetical protein